jgi:hypothetical protein
MNKPDLNKSDLIKPAKISAAATIIVALITTFGGFIVGKLTRTPGPRPIDPLSIEGRYKGYLARADQYKSGDLELTIPRPSEDGFVSVHFVYNLTPSDTTDNYQPCQYSRNQGILSCRGPGSAFYPGELTLFRGGPFLSGIQKEGGSGKLLAVAHLQLLE